MGADIGYDGEKGSQAVFAGAGKFLSVRKYLSVGQKIYKP
jgi:hypothetical protein